MTADISYAFHCIKKSTQVEVSALTVQNTGSSPSSSSSSSGNDPVQENQKTKRQNSTGRRTTHSTNRWIRTERLNQEMSGQKAAGRRWGARCVMAVSRGWMRCRPLPAQTRSWGLALCQDVMKGCSDEQQQILKSPSEEDLILDTTESTELKYRTRMDLAWS